MSGQFMGVNLFYWFIIYTNKFSPLKFGTEKRVRYKPKFLTSYPGCQRVFFSLARSAEATKASDEKLAAKKRVRYKICSVQFITTNGQCLVSWLYQS